MLPPPAYWGSLGWLRCSNTWDAFRGMAKRSSYLCIAREWAHCSHYSASTFACFYLTEFLLSLNFYRISISECCLITIHSFSLFWVTLSIQLEEFPQTNNHGLLLETAIIIGQDWPKPFFVCFRISERFGYERGDLHSGVWRHTEHPTQSFIGEAVERSRICIDCMIWW